jgi:gliding motility-associated-like protein
MIKRGLKRTLLCVVFLYAAMHYSSAGNDPCSSTPLDPYSSDLQIFNNSANTDSGIPPPPYGGYAGQDIWFDFVMPPGGLVNLIVSGGSMTDPAIAIYSGACDDPKLLYNILDDNCDQDLGPAAILDELTPGETYLIRVWAQNGSGNGSFSIFLSETTEYQPGFFLHSDASEDGDCIMLTDDINTQHGCAWFELPIDFTQPFIHEMTANFGDVDFNGADGICLIYQSNGTDYCGDSGGGIGASGMPNSAIFEFDTYQNGQYSDPYDDHCAFNINGDMNHLNSIEGPVTLGNIEDGLDHSIEFHYDGSGGYELYFDGNLLLSGNYDFINNIFGGSTTAWWGYTAATGALNNEHVICPETEDIELGTQEYQEAFLCPGESFNGYSESGFYIDYESGSGNCLHQINTYIEVYEEPEPGYLETMICSGEIFEYNGSYYDQPGSYELLESASNGCDSIVYLEITMPELEIYINGSEPINCSNPQVELDLEVYSDPAYDYVDFYWDTPTGRGYDWYYEATEAGYYDVTVTFYLGDYFCDVTTSTFIDVDTISPQISHLEDINIDCNQLQNNIYLEPVVSGGGDLEFNWYHENEWFNSGEIISILEDGIYVLEVINLENGCSSKDSALVTYSTDFLELTLNENQLDCQTDSFPIELAIEGEVDSLYWEYNGVYFSDQPNPIVVQAGTYSLTAVSIDGCVSRDTLQVLVDTISPLVDVVDYIIPCDSTSIQITVETDSTNSITWHPDHSIPMDLFDPVVSETGSYHFTVTNPHNHCQTEDSLLVSTLGKSPELILSAGSITCYQPEVSIDVNTDMEDLEFTWTFEDSIYAHTADLIVALPGYYYLQAISQTGCSSRDSIEIKQNTQHPSIVLSGDTLNCHKDQVTLAAFVEFADSLQWTGPGGLSVHDTNWSVDHEGIYLFQAWNTGNGCTSIDSIEIIDLSYHPGLTLDYDTLNCHQPAIYLNLEVDTSYQSVQWTLASGNSTTDFQPLIETGGWIDLHLEVEGPCDLDTSFFVVEDFKIPEFDLSGNLIDCRNPETTILIENQDDDVRFEIIDPEGNLFYQESLTSSIPGLYYAILTGTNGCSSHDSIEIRAYLDPPEADIYSNGPITCAEPKAAVWVASEEDNLAFLWSGPGISNAASQMIEALEAGSYEVEISNLHGCKDTLLQTVEAFLDPPEFQLSGNDITCDYPESHLHFESTDSDLSISWQDENKKQLSGESDLTTTSPGWYYLVAENEFGCKNTDSLLISEHSTPPEIEVLSDNPLLVETYLDDRAFIEIAIESEAPYVLSWEPAIDLSCDDCLPPQVLGDEIETYTVYVENDYGCSNEERIDIRYKNKTIIQIPNVFSPHNQDALNDYFTLFGNENVEIIEELKVFDRWGNLVFLTTDFPPNIPELGWDGNFRGRLASKGVYVYVFRVRTIEGEILIYSGDVTIL